MLAQSQQVLQLTLTAGGGDVAAGGLLMLRRVAGRRESIPLAAAPAAALVELARMGWVAFSELLQWEWEYLAYEVEPTGLGPAGVVDFILTDGSGYTYVQARRWRQQEVTAGDIQTLAPTWRWSG